MDIINIVQAHIFGIIILFLIFLNSKKNSRYILFDQRLFLNLVILTISLLSVDMIRRLLSGGDGLSSRILYIGFSSLGLLLAPVASLIWFMYSDYKIHENKLRLQRKLPILGLPLGINLVLLILNLTPGSFQGCLFTIDSMNIYSRGPCLYMILFISYFYLLYAFINICRNKKLLNSRDYYSLLVFILPPILGSLVQVVFYEINFTWLAMAVSIFIIFMNIQNKELSLDALTGLYNQRKLNIYLDSTLDRRKDNILGGIMIDLDDFKLINDSFGHRQGDQALVHVADILRSSFRKEDFLARYGGDEFLIVLSLKKASEIDDIVKRLKTNVENFNRENIAPYDLSLSIGYDVFCLDGSITSDDFVNRIDNLMYEEKLAKEVTC